MALALCTLLFNMVVALLIIVLWGSNSGVSPCLAGGMWLVLAIVWCKRCTWGSTEKSSALLACHSVKITTMPQLLGLLVSLRDASATAAPTRIRLLRFA
jgi:hypothetical protein